MMPLCDQWRAAEILDDLGLPGVFFAPMRPFARLGAVDGWCSQHLLHALAEHLGWREFARRVEPHLRGLQPDTDEMERLYHYEVPEKRRLKYALAFALPPTQTAQILRDVNAHIGLTPDSWYLARAQLRALEAAGHCRGRARF